MTSHTQDVLIDKTITAIRELVEINIDSYNGFAHAAASANETSLRDQFSMLALQRIRQAVELNQLIFPSHGQKIWEGSIAGRIHRAIMDWKDKFASGPQALLTDVERGEAYIKAKYESVLSHVSHQDIVDVLQKHYRAVKDAYESIRKLRATFKAG